MYAALKGSFLEAVLYRGRHQGGTYPPWFHSEIFEGPSWMEEDEKICVMTTDESDEAAEYVTLYPNETVVLRNKFGELFFSDLDTISGMYLPVGPNMIADPIDTVEFYVLDRHNFKHGMPNWVSEEIANGRLIIGQGLSDNVFVDELLGDSMLGPVSVLVRNRNGTVRAMTLEEFNKYFDASYPYYY